MLAPGDDSSDAPTELTAPIDDLFDIVWDDALRPLLLDVETRFGTLEGLVGGRVVENGMVVVHRDILSGGSGRSGSGRD